VSCEDELAVLEGAWDSDRSEFIVVYGWRRAGKTALLQTFCAKRPHAFWVASPSSWLSEIPPEPSNGVSGVVFLCVLPVTFWQVVRYIW